MQPTRNLTAALLGTAAVLTVCVALPARADVEKAAPAAAFADSVGVCTHWGYGDTPYGAAYEGVKKKLLESDIRHFRDGIMRPVEVQRIEELGRLGVHACIVAEPEVGTPQQIQAIVKSINARVPGAIDAVEGPNEPDLFWASNKKAYGGKSGANGEGEAVQAAVLFQKDLYTALKADPATRGVTSIGIALGKTYEPGKNPISAGSLADFADWGNAHPYFGGNPFSFPFPYGGVEKFYWQGTHPGTNIDEFPYVFQTYQPPYAPKPMAFTEAGCATDTNGTSEAAHGKYIPRMFLEYFRKGVKRTYSYEFVDEFPDGNNREARFGLLRRDLTEKPAYTALKNLLAVLKDDGAKPFTPGALDFALKVTPAGGYDRLQYVHHQLFQKAHGAFYLAVWHEVTAEDGSTKPRRQIAVPPLPATLTVASKVYPQARVYSWDDAGAMTETAEKLDAGNALRFDVTDRVTVIKLAPVPAAAATPKPKTPTKEPKR
jgi:hypothetical protein